MKFSEKGLARKIPDPATLQNVDNRQKIASLVKRIGNSWFLDWWDVMKPFLCSQFVKVIAFIKECENAGERAENANLAREFEGRILKADDLPIRREVVEKHYKRMVESAYEQCKQIGLKAATDRCEHFRNYLAQDWVSFGGIAVQARVLRESIEAELEVRQFALVPESKGRYQQTVETDWRPCLTNFPSCKREIIDAVDAYALDLNTACVFHLMRIAEYGLRALAKERKVKLPKNMPLEYAEWQAILAQLEAAAESVRQWKRGHVRDKALDFYRGVIAELAAFKDEYRNHVMHTRKKFDEFQAERVLLRVRDFMNRLSAVLDEKPKRSVDWRKM